MHINTATAIVNAACSEGDYDVTARPDYMGRGARVEVAGVVCDNPLVIAAYACIALQMMSDSEAIDFIEDLKELRQDSMGTRSIVY